MGESNDTISTPMIPLYKNNYLRVSGHAADFAVDLDPLPNQTNDYYQESCRAAEELYDLKQGPLHILYSGGIDSEYCLSVFLSLGMDVTPVIVKLNAGYNDYDTAWAFKFCESKNITPKVIDIDFDHFLNSGKLYDITVEIGCSTYGRAPIAYAAGLLDGTVILGDGEPYIRLNSETETWNLEIDEHDFSVYNYFKKYGIHGTTHFNRWTPEMFVSFMRDPRMAELANNQHPGKLSSNTSRYIIYNRHSNFDLKERHKFHGFELIHKKIMADHPMLAKIEEHGKTCNGLVAVNYHSLTKSI
jgi:hypothetical protein